VAHWPQRDLEFRVLVTATERDAELIKWNLLKVYKLRHGQLPALNKVIRGGPKNPQEQRHLDSIRIKKPWSLTSPCIVQIRYREEVMQPRDQHIADECCGEPNVMA
jgi:hypothetical protein